MSRKTSSDRKVNQDKMSGIKWSKVFKGSVNFMRFVLFSGAFVVLAFAFIQVSRVYLRSDVVPDVSVPVSRFIANVDFDTRTVELDSTISKVYSSPVDITIWRFGDGSVIKSGGETDIRDHEVISHTFEEPGSYTIGYSIIDEDDLSDESLCTISFADEEDGVFSDWISDECGKSYVGYNSLDNVYGININKRLIRQSILYAIASLLVIVYTVFFVKKRRFQ